MQSRSNPNIILICKNGRKQLIAKSLEKDFNVICKEKNNSVIFLIRTNQIDAIINYIDNEKSSGFELNNKIANYTASVPKLAIINDSNDLELIRRCGEAGFLKVMLYSDLSVLPGILKKLIDDTIIKVTLTELGIKINENMPGLLKQALLYIEKEYIRLKSIEEITDYLDTSYKTLSCYLRQALLPSPKIILMFLKIRHSLYLLKESNLLNKEIALKSGFTDEKRFAECIRRMFDKTPRECRYILLTQSIDVFWQKTIKATSTPAYQEQKEEYK